MMNDSIRKLKRIGKWLLLSAAVIILGVGLIFCCNILIEFLMTSGFSAGVQNIEPENP
jgi:hypothetical protein